MEQNISLHDIWYANEVRMAKNKEDDSNFLVSLARTNLFNWGMLEFKF